MQGSPLIRALLTFLVIAAFGYPVWNLTHGRTIAPPPKETVTPVQEIGMQFTFSGPAESAAMQHLGSAIWRADHPGISTRAKVKIPYPKEGVDLVFQVKWPDSVENAALRVELTDPDGNVHDKTVWGKGNMEEVITFP